MKGYIYEIVSPNFEKRYIGCCIQNGRGRDTLKERFHHHKGKHNGTTSRYVIEKGDAEIRLIECNEVENIQELRVRERQHISSRRDELVNETSIYSSPKEQKDIYIKEHKDEKRAYDIEYRAKKKEHDNTRFTCECGGTYMLKHKSTHSKTKIHTNYLGKLTV